jgi:hypothetical protein
MVNYKLRTKKRPEIMPNGRVKRTGATYYEVDYIKGGYWTSKDFNTRKDATEFIGGLYV